MPWFIGAILAVSLERIERLFGATYELGKLGDRDAFLDISNDFRPLQGCLGFYGLLDCHGASWWIVERKISLSFKKGKIRKNRNYSYAGSKKYLLTRERKVFKFTSPTNPAQSEVSKVNAFQGIGQAFERAINSHNLPSTSHALMRIQELERQNKQLRDALAAKHLANQVLCRELDMLLDPTAEVEMPDGSHMLAPRELILKAAAAVLDKYAGEMDTLMSAETVRSIQKSRDDADIARWEADNAAQGIE